MGTTNKTAIEAFRESLNNYKPTKGNHSEMLIKATELFGRDTVSEAFRPIPKATFDRWVSGTTAPHNELQPASVSTILNLCEHRLQQS